MTLKRNHTFRPVAVEEIGELGDEGNSNAGLGVGGFSARSHNSDMDVETNSRFRHKEQDYNIEQWDEENDDLEYFT